MSRYGMSMLLSTEACASVIFAFASFASKVTLIELPPGTAAVPAELPPIGHAVEPVYGQKLYGLILLV